MTAIAATPAYENLERVVIGRMVISTADRLAFGSLLAPADFALPCRAWLFRELQHIADGQTDSALVESICQHARWPGKQVDWRDVARTELTYCIGIARTEAEMGFANPDEYARKLRAARVIRRSKEACMDFYDRAGGSTGPDLETDLDKLIAGLQEQQAKFLKPSDGPTTLGAIARQAIANLDAKDNVRSCGYTLLQCVHEVTGPFQLGCTYIITGGPGSGKTALAWQIARDVSMQSRVIYITIENTKIQLAERAISSQAQVPIDQWKHRYFTPQQRDKMDAHVGDLDHCNIEVEDAVTSRTYEQIVAMIRRKHREAPVGMFVIDYLQRVQLQRPGRDRNSELETISGGFRDLAAELQISLVLLSSMNREGPKEKRRPQMSDLRGCGQIEYDAHTILAMWKVLSDGESDKPKWTRPQYVDDSVEGISNIEIIVLKQRDGEEGRAIPATFHKKIGAIKEPRPGHPSLNQEARN